MSGQADLDTAAYARLREDALGLLTGWAPPDAEQTALRDAFVEHLTAHPGAMSRSGPPAHLTASVMVLDTSGDAALLTLHRRAREWFQLGGHYEPEDASVWAAAAREAREESGIPGLTVLPQVAQLDRHLLAGDFGRCREHLDIRFAAVAPADVDPRVSDESLDVRWWPVDALPEGTAAELAPLVAAARRLTRR